jgi:hypothetical protein
MGTDAGNEHTAAVKQVIADLWESKIVKAAAIGGGIVISLWLAGRLFHLLGDTAKGYRHMLNNFKTSVAPPK